MQKLSLEPSQIALRMTKLDLCVHPTMLREIHERLAGCSQAYAQKADQS